MRAAWIVGEDGDEARPDYDHDNIVTLTVARDGTSEISVGSLWQPVEESQRLYALLGYCAYWEIDCTIGGDTTIRPQFSFFGRSAFAAFGRK